jgi:hypothetical protein
MLNFNNQLTLHVAYVPRTLNGPLWTLTAVKLLHPRGAPRREKTRISAIRTMIFLSLISMQDPARDIAAAVSPTASYCESVYVQLTFD